MGLRHAAGAVVLALVLAAAGGCAGALSGPSMPTTTPAGTAEDIPIELSKPDGTGPFPAVVIMHDSSGLGPRSSGASGRWAKELVKPDSFTTRGHPDGVCTDASCSRDDVSPGRRVRDAYAALAYLRTLSYVDAARIGLMGGSHGGSTTLSSMIAPESDADALARERRGGFAAAVALYPGCVASRRTWSGTAYHSFDSYNPVCYVATRVNANAPGGRGATTGGDPTAWADSIREVNAFFARYLRVPGK